MLKVILVYDYQINITVNLVNIKVISLLKVILLFL